MVDSPYSGDMLQNAFLHLLVVSSLLSLRLAFLLQNDLINCENPLLPQDLSQQIPTQELVAKDLHNFEWRFKHIFRGKHLQNTFCNRGECGELRVGVRRQARQQAMIPTSVISSQSMHLGVLATASHAVTTHTLFTVYYKPRFGT
ncbi:hypothetical protein GW17_00029362 [Ensete ventricosum]|nr:hypothetical protein GW17_00029362 [Ensete ventricosum]